VRIATKGVWVEDAGGWWPVEEWVEREEGDVRRVDEVLDVAGWQRLLASVHIAR